MADSQKTSVGIIGLGIIGSRVAAAVRRAGFSVMVWNRTPRPEPNFLSSPREIAESADVIQIFVRDGVALLEVIESLRPALRENHVVINHSTVSPGETLEAARLVAERKAAFLDAPFTGSRDAAELGELVYYLAGDEAVLERVRPVLEASSRVIVPMGPVGAATYVKLAVNMITAAEIQVLSEALALLDRGGVPLTLLSEALEYNLANSVTISLKIPLMLTGELDARFSVKNMLKDLQIVLRSVESKKIDLPATSATAGSLMGAVQAGWGDEDFAAVSRHYPYAGSLKAHRQESAATPEAAAPEVKTEEIASSAAIAPPSESVTTAPAKKSFFGFLKSSRGRSSRTDA